MTVETGNTISNLKPGWPLKSDPKSQGDDHIRIIKHILQTQFPDGADGDGFKIPITATSQQINWLSGVDSDIQTQLDHLGDAIGESGLSGDVTYNSQRIVLNTEAIGSTSSGLIQAVNANTAAITKLNSSPHLHIAGSFFGATLAVQSGSGFSVSRSPGFLIGAYTITFDVPTIGEYTVTISAGALSSVDTVTTNSFHIVTMFPDGSGSIDPIDPEEVHFIVVDV